VVKLSGAAGLVGACLLGACGPSYAPLNAPARPCTQISADEFATALAGGAARADARIDSSGVVTMDTGPGVVHCATFRNSTIRPCRRPNDFVIRYDLGESGVMHVLVRKNEQYRFRVQARPTTCEIVNEE